MTSYHTNKLVTVISFMSDSADLTIPPNLFRTIEQAIQQAYLNFQAEFLPARSSSSQGQDSPSTSSSTLPLISSPRQGIKESNEVLVI